MRRGTGCGMTTLCAEVGRGRDRRDRGPRGGGGGAGEPKQGGRSVLCRYLLFLLVLACHVLGI